MNKIKECQWCVTPESMADLEDRLNLPNPTEKSIAWWSAMMAWNLACKLVNESETETTEQSMVKKIPLKSGDEYDILTSARKFYHLKAGEAKKVKRKYNKRFRKVSKSLTTEE